MLALITTACEFPKGIEFELNIVWKYPFNLRIKTTSVYQYLIVLAFLLFLFSCIVKQGLQVPPKQDFHLYPKGSNPHSEDGWNCLDPAKIRNRFESVCAEAKNEFLC